MGNYIKTSLLPSETVIREAKLHWIIFAKPVVNSFVLYYVFKIFLTVIDPTIESPGQISGVIIFIIFFIPMMISTIIEWWSTELAITNKRVIAKTGFISRDTTELRHEKVESMNIKQSILGRILGYGTITINGTGGVHTPIKNIDEPMVFRRAALEEVEKLSVQVAAG